MPNDRWSRTGAGGVPGRRAAQRTAGGGLRAPTRRRGERRAHRRGMRHRGRRDRVCDRRARWPPLLLRRQRALELRRGRAAGGGIRPVRASCGFPRTGGGLMRFGYWLPVFGGWLRNVEDEGMSAEWSYVRRLARASERLGFDLTLIAELNLHDIKGETRRRWAPGRPRRVSRRCRAA